MTDTWYSPGQIRFGRDEMIWLIECLSDLELGVWPKQPGDTGYTDAPNVQKSRNFHAPFETPAQIFAEVTSRIDKTGDAGETLIWEVQHGMNDYSLLSPPAKRALNYISGWRRRRSAYRDWLKQVKYRGRVK